RPFRTASNPARPRRPGGTATGLPTGSSAHRPRSLAASARPRRDGSGPRKAWHRRSVWPASEGLALFDAGLLTAVDHGDQPDEAAVATIPVDREEGEGAAFAGHRVEIAADILDAEDARLEDLLVHRFPFGKVVLPVVAARPFPVFLGEVRQQRTVALRAD